MRTRLAALAVLTAFLTLSAACGSTQTRGSGGDLLSPASYGGGHAGGHASGDTEAGAAFARWVLEQDPRREYITDAVVRDEQTLGVKVQPNVRKGELERLMMGLTEGMARTFPGTPVRVIAFYQSGDKLAESAYDPRTGNVDVDFAG